MPFDELEGHVSQVMEQLQKEKRDIEAAQRRSRNRASARKR